MHYFEPKRCASTAKIMYHSKVEAQRAANLSFIERGVELWVYRCQSCTAWHLTSHNPEAHLPSISHEATKPRSRKRGYKPRRK